MLLNNHWKQNLQSTGWTVIRFWSREVKTNLDDCVAIIREAIEQSAAHKI